MVSSKNQAQAMEGHQGMDMTQVEASGFLEVTTIIAASLSRLNINNNQDKFWEYKLWFEAIENIAWSEERRPGMSPALRKALLELVAQVKTSRIQTTSERNNKAPSSRRLEISKSDESILKTWISVELTAMQNEFVESYKNRLKDSNEPTETELLKQLKESNNPIDLIIKKVQEQKDENRKLETEIEKLTRARDEAVTLYEKELLAAQEALSAFQEEVMAKRPEVLEQYTNLLKQRDDVLTKQLELAKIKQIMDENPPELTEEMENLYSRLLQAIDKLEAEARDLNELKSKYEALGPEFKKVVAEWTSVEEEIETKEWVISQLHGNCNRNLSGNTSLNDSLFSP